MPSIASSESSTRGSSSTRSTVAGSPIILAGGLEMAPRPPALGRAPAKPWRASRLKRVSSRPGRSRRPPRQGQPDREGRPAARRALGADVAAVLLDDLVADREPEPGPFADALRREEGTEDAADHVGRDAGAGVADRDDGASVLHARLDGDGARPGDRLRRVGKEIQEHLVELRANALDRRQPAEGPLHGD